jgi:hypothetical protein
VGAGFPLVVTDLDGRLLTERTDVTDLSDVVLDDGGDTLLAAQGFHQVIAIDAATLTITATYPAPSGACVYTVEPSGGKVVGGYVDCGIGSGGLLVWSAPGSEPVVYTDGPNYQPVMDASRGAPGLLVAGDSGYSPVTTYLIDVRGDRPSIVAHRDNTGSNLRDYALSPDGTEVVESTGAPYEHHAYRVPDLSDAVIYPSGSYPDGAAWSGDSTTVVVGRGSALTDPQFYFYPRGTTTPTYVVDLHVDDVFWSGTLLMNRAGTRAWAVSYDDVYQEVALLHSFGPGHPPNPPVTDLAGTATKGSGRNKSTAYITVSWTTPHTDADYWWITASTTAARNASSGAAPCHPAAPTSSRTTCPPAPPRSPFAIRTTGTGTRPATRPRPCESDRITPSRVAGSPVTAARRPPAGLLRAGLDLARLPERGDQHRHTSGPVHCDAPQVVNVARPAGIHRAASAGPRR